MADFKCIVGADGTQQMVELTPEEYAQKATDAAAHDAANTQEQNRIAREGTFLAQPDRVDMLARLRQATPAQIDAYVDANVANIAQARAMFKQVLKLLALNVAR